MQRKLKHNPLGKNQWNGGSGGKKIVPWHSFDVEATTVPSDRRCMGVINQFQQPLHMQSDYSGQGVNWILTGRSDTCSPVVGSLSK